MSAEAFKNLIEIQGLLNAQKQHLIAIDEQNKRLTHIEKLQQTKAHELSDCQNQIDTLKKEATSDETNINEHHRLLEKIKDDFFKLKNEKEVQNLKDRESLLLKEKNQFEESLFKKMEREEELLKEVTNLKNFMTGMQTTKKELELEVKITIEKEQIKADGYQKRIDALVEELPNDAHWPYRLATQKHPLKFLSFIQNIHCGVCRYEIERSTVSLIDRCQVFELCASCGRLLAPHSIPH